MGKEKKLFKSEEKRNRSDVSAFLQQLADKIGEGQVILRQGKDELPLNFPQYLVLEIQVEDEKKKRKGIQHSLEIVLSPYPTSAAEIILELPETSRNKADDSGSSLRRVSAIHGR